jgi:hypothetical protein
LSVYKNPYRDNIVLVTDGSGEVGKSCCIFSDRRLD